MFIQKSASMGKKAILLVYLQVFNEAISLSFDFCFIFFDF